MISITLDDFKRAHKVIKEKIFKTPLVPFLKQPNITFKAEMLQPSGSFKIRGASYIISLLTEEERKKGVIAYSTGNHAQAVALAAKREGIKATIVMSPDVLPSKIEATKKLNAEVILVESHERRSFTENEAKRTGAFLVPPYDHPAIITGQGTIGLEIIDEMIPSYIFVPVGGGGLISGIAMCVKQINPNIKFIGVEPELEDDATRSFKEKKLISLDKCSHTIADAVRITSLGHLTYPLLLNYVDDMITVSEEEITEATLSMLQTHLVTEPSGALALAGALKYNVESNKKIVCIASGGNTVLK